MRVRMLGVFGAVVVLGVIALLMNATQVDVAGQTTSGATADASLKTPWGEPDLQGILTDEFDTPFERPERFGDREFMPAEEQAELDDQRAGLLSRDRRVESNMQLLEFRCAEFAEEFMYDHLRKEPVVQRWESETMDIKVTRKIPEGDACYDWDPR